MKTIINNIEMADYDEGQTTAVINAVLGDKEENFHVQTVDGLYRQELGCELTTDNSNGEIDQDDYEGFNFSLIISAAEKLIEGQSTIKASNNNDYYIKVYSDKSEVLERNHNFINQDTSSYQTEYKIIETCSDEENALVFIENL